MLERPTHKWRDAIFAPLVHLIQSVPLYIQYTIRVPVIFTSSLNLSYYILDMLCVLSPMRYLN